MRRIALVMGIVAVLGTSAAAQTVTLYLHKSPVPVAVPGGTTTFVLDANPPTATTPVVESLSVSKTLTQAFPTFIAPTFAAPATLGLDFDVDVHLSANLAMNGCAVLGATIERVDTAGLRTVVARGTLVATVPQGGSGGTVGYSLQDISVSIGCDRPTDDVTIQAGESIAVTVNVMNACKANRTLFLAYDATVAAGDATFSPTLPPDEVFLRACFAKCQQGTSKAIARFVTAKNKCVLKCESNARRGFTSFTECYPPYSGATLACITDPLKGAETKAAASIRKYCPAPGRCPPCYSGGNCVAHADLTVATIESGFDSFVPGIYCENTTVSGIGKCMDGNAKALYKLFASEEKCYDKCFKNEARGLAAPNSCLPLPTDPPTATCLLVAQNKAVAAINTACFLATPPACYDSITAAAWVNLMSIFVATQIPQTYCGS
jgi:hypothetical protein